MTQYQMRIYTLATPEAAETYARVHWARHVESLKAFGICTHAVWRESDAPGHTRVFALVSYDGEDFAAQNARYMESPAFRADMEGFDFRNIVKVEEIDLEQVDVGLSAERQG